MKEEDAVDAVVNPTEAKEPNTKVHHIRRRRHSSCKLEREVPLTGLKRCHRVRESGKNERERTTDIPIPRKPSNFGR